MLALDPSGAEIGSEATARTLSRTMKYASLVLAYFMVGNGLGESLILRQQNGFREARKGSECLHSTLLERK